MLEARKASCHVASALAKVANIQAENLQNVQKMPFWQKAPGVNGFKQLSNSGKKVNLNFSLIV